MLLLIVWVAALPIMTTHPHLHRLRLAQPRPAF
jgi:hypothetical protein